MLLSAAMATVEVHVKMVESHQPGVLSDKETSLCNWLRKELVLFELSGAWLLSLTGTVPPWSPFYR